MRKALRLSVRNLQSVFVDVGKALLCRLYDNYLTHASVDFYWSRGAGRFEPLLHN